MLNAIHTYGISNTVYYEAHHLTLYMPPKTYRLISILFCTVDDRSKQHDICPEFFEQSLIVKSTHSVVLLLSMEARQNRNIQYHSLV